MDRLLDLLLLREGVRDLDLRLCDLEYDLERDLLLRDLEKDGDRDRGLRDREYDPDRDLVRDLRLLLSRDRERDRLLRLNISKINSLFSEIFFIFSLTLSYTETTISSYIFDKNNLINSSYVGSKLFISWY